MRESVTLNIFNVYLSFLKVYVCYADLKIIDLYKYFNLKIAERRLN